MEKYTLKALDLTTAADKIAYKGYLEQIEDQNPFYKLELLEYHNKNQTQLKYFIFFEDGNPKILMNFIVREINSSLPKGPFYDVISPYGYSGPLFNTQINSETIINFWKMADEWYLTHNMVSEFIRFGLNKNHLYYSGSTIRTLSNVCGSIVPEAEQWQNFKPKVRNNYRKSLQENLEHGIWHKNITPDKIREFYDIYLDTMSRNTADESYHYSLDYFSSFIGANPENCMLILIYKDNVPISTELILLNKNTMYSFLGGTVSDYFYTRPNDFLKIKAINWGRKKGFSHYVLGGGRIDGDGLYAYKKTFFPKDQDLDYYTGRKIINHQIYQELCEEVCEDKRNIDLVNSQNLATGYFPKYRLVSQKPNIKEEPEDLQIIRDPKEWRNYLKEFKAYDFYHTYDYHMLSKKPGEDAVLIRYRKDGTIIALPLIIRGIPNTELSDATSVYGYAGPLVKGPITNSISSSFQNSLKAYCLEKNIISIFSRLNPYIPNQAEALQAMGKIEVLGKVVNMDIQQDLEISRANYSKSTKSRVNKARKQCYTKLAESEEDIKLFVEIYNENMRRLSAGSDYFFDFDYFFKFFKSTDFKTDVILVNHNETHEAIAGSMFVKTNGIVQFHLSGTKDDFLHIAPARVFLDEMRIIATQQEYKYFNLGGGLGGNEDSLFEFKASFSKDFKDFKVWKYIVDPAAYDELCKSLDKSIIEEKVGYFPLYRAN